MKRFIFILLTLLVLFVPACNKKQSPSDFSVIGHTMTSIDIMQVIDKAGVMPDHQIILDREYVTPSRSWIINQFSPVLYDDLIESKMIRFVGEQNDCDNFSVNAWSLLKKCNNATPTANRRDIAGGIFGYKPDTGGGHAINFFIVYEGTNYTLYFYEPQTREFKKLSKDEKMNCMFIIM